MIIQPEQLRNIFVENYANWNRVQEHITQWVLLKSVHTYIRKEYKGRACPYSKKDFERDLDAFIRWQWNVPVECRKVRFTGHRDSRKSYYVVAHNTSYGFFRVSLAQGEKYE